MQSQKSKIILSAPPVMETVLGIQFADLARWTSVHHGLFFPMIRNDFPRFRLMPEQPAIVETFPPSTPKIRLELSSQPGPDCACFLNDEETQLIRIQKNRFSYHWIGLPDGTYPHYSSNIRICSDIFRMFEEFCKFENVGTINPVLCEVMYLNNIHPMNGHSIPQLLREVFEIDLGDFELTSVNRTFALGGNRGRLYAEINNTEQDGHEILQFKLTARIRHDNEAGQEKESPIETLNIGHDWLIEHFLKLTNQRVRIAEWRSNE